MTRQEIETLIGSVALGDRKAFNSLYDATSAKLLGVCLRILRDRAAAEDAMQDTFIKVWKNADRFAVNGYSPMTWLITIARNTSIDRLRASKPTADIDDYTDTIAASGPTAEGRIIATGEARRITNCFAELEPTRSAAIKAAYLDGLPYAELAQKFNVPLNTMRTWLRRGLIALRECLSK
ncbi:RNA polymerase sigma-70 factor (ECF subfamily) [Loktanella ponticola]|uniref:RNA polymerase sigma-70 factor (ECF subfamily) n=1 Tax=Yoonia ponticola TaxID=1524255 RepID=A0A7W9BHM0_9RHOB|nr:sigma-70 family RNA polymerase sigma factor [Yoonia ponticola]MBB5720590.1 RNA polymerase sigma-70 factor (ECF subfamily) [Yoonia ponticola]